MATHTRVHTYIAFANPYLVCPTCTKPVVGSHDREGCECGTPSRLMPCTHPAPAVSTCPSWGPVDECRCATPCPAPTTEGAAS